MDLPTNQEIRSFYRAWLKAEYGMDMDHLPSPALATIVDFTKACLEKYGTVPLIGKIDITPKADPYIDQLDSL